MYLSIWRSKTILLKSVLSIYHEGPRNQVQAVQHSSKCPYTLSHLAGPLVDFLLNTQGNSVGKYWSLKQLVLKWWGLCMPKKSLTHFTPYSKLNSSLIIDLNAKHNRMKFIKENRNIITTLNSWDKFHINS